MTFFYNLNKKLDEIRATPELTHSQLNERDMSRAAKGLKALDPVRAKYDKYDNKEVDEGLGNMAKKVGGMAKQVAGKAMNALHGSDADMMRDLQKKMGVPQTGMKPGDESNPKIIKPSMKEAAKYRDPKYKDMMYTQEPPEADHDEFDDYDDPKKPADYPGKKRVIGGGTSGYDNNDPLTRGFGRSGTGSPVEKGPRKGLPKRDQITSLKGSIKDAHGRHPHPNLPEEGGVPMSAKQKSFAALAEPKDKITFADRIAGAKKEVDEMLGDVAAEAMKSALGGKRRQMADEASQDNAFTAHKRPRAEVPKVGTTTHGAKHDTTEIPGGRRVTRRTDASGMSVGAEDDTPVDGAPRGRGRPKGPTKAPERVTGGATRHKGGRKTNEGDQDPEDTGEYDQEGQMAKDTIQTVVRHAQALQKILGDNENLPEWVQSKLAKIEGMMTAVDDYMQNQDGDDQDTEEPIAEKAVSKKQQRFMGMVHATQKGEKAPSKEVGKVAKTMKKADAEDFASTKQKGLPEKTAKKKEKTEEAGGTNTPTASSGFSYGKGIYDSMSRELENMIAESMSVNMSDSTEGGKSLTITATDDDAMKLAVLLKSAGIGGGMNPGDTHQHEEACPSCGQSPCGCDEEMHENKPDYPTNTEMAQDNFGYSGGLNRPKSTGQTTVPVIASQDERQMAYESDLRRMREIAGIQEAKKEVDEADVEEGNKFAFNVIKAKAAGKKEADLDGDGDLEKVRESIFDLTNQWRVYKG